MKTKLNKEESSENTNNTKRFILLVLLPSLIVLFTLGYFYSLGRFITTENAYIKAPIISIQSEISGRIDQVYIKNNQKISKGEKLFKIDVAKLNLDLAEQKEILSNTFQEIENIKAKYKEAQQKINLANEKIIYFSSEINRIKNILKVDTELAQEKVNFYYTDLKRLKRSYKVKIKLAEEKLKFKKIELDRIKLLVDKGVGLKSKLQEVKHLYNLAFEELNSSKINTDIERTDYLYNTALKSLKSIKINSKIEEVTYEYNIAKSELELARQKAKTILTTLFNDKNINTKKHPLYLKQLNKFNQIKFDINKSTVFAEQDGIITQMNLEEGEYIDVGKILFAIVDEKKAWLEANLKETDLTNIKVGQSALFIPDSYPNSTWNAQVESISPATGAEFSILPPQNSSGNWVKVVQRIPVRLSISDLNNKKTKESNVNRDLRVGMSVSVTIDTKYEGEAPLIIRPFSKIFKLFWGLIETFNIRN